MGILATRITSIRPLFLPARLYSASIILENVVVIIITKMDKDANVLG